jgi:hypothetical protein
MKILSIDVGIKNLAFCLMNKTDKNTLYNIELWDILNLSSLSESSIPMCTQITYKKIKKTKDLQQTPCNRVAKFKKKQEYFCSIHSKKNKNLLVQNNELNIQKLKKLKKTELLDIYLKYKPLQSVNDLLEKESIQDNKITKSQILAYMEKYIEIKCFESITNINAKDVSLIDVGIILNKKFNDILKIHNDIDIVIIENQISPLANRMKTIQGMITQYFIMKGIINIHFISSSNKLKINNELISYDNNAMTYNERKKEGIKNTLFIISNNNIYDKWIEYFGKHKKKDDLADSFLQCIWFISKRININLQKNN